MDLLLKVFKILIVYNYQKYMLLKQKIINEQLMEKVQIRRFYHVSKKIQKQYSIKKIYN